MSHLDNGAIRIGVDLDLGGSITFLTTSGKDASENVINSHDPGCQVQRSFYSGPQPFGTSYPGWKNFPWNPIGSGDVYGKPSRGVEHANDGKTLSIKTTPKQWALNSDPGECVFETWITPDGSTARVRCRLTNHRTDTTQYPATDQELPVVYTVGNISRLVTYDGLLPSPVRRSGRSRTRAPPGLTGRRPRTGRRC